MRALLWTEAAGGPTTMVDTVSFFFFFSFEGVRGRESGVVQVPGQSWLGVQRRIGPIYRRNMAPHT